MAEEMLKEFIEEEIDNENFTSSITSGNFEELIENNKIPLVFSLIGISLIGLGVFIYKSGLIDVSNKIEVIENNRGEQTEKAVIYVEASGALQKPGVYKMTEGDRVEDLLLLSGGLSSDADVIWVEKNINRAAKLVDGQKIYIPIVDEQSNNVSAKSTSLDDNFSINANITQTELININTATQEVLESLWGIGPVTGKNIIDHRPYSSVSELKDKGILKSNVYEANKDKLSVY